MTSNAFWVVFCLLISTLSTRTLELQEGEQNEGDNILDTSSYNTESDEHQSSDVTDLIDLEAMLFRASSYKVVLSRGKPELKINGSIVETNEGIRKLLTFINNAKQFAGTEGFSSRSSHESEGMLTTQMQHREHNGIWKRDNRYEIYYWKNKYQGPEANELLEEYNVKVICQPDPPGHTMTVKGHAFTRSTAVWMLTVTEACRFWKS